MNKQNNKKNLPNTSVAQKPNAISTLASLSAQPKAAPADQPTHDFPHQDQGGASTGPTHNEIAVRAHEIFVEEGRPQGQSDEIWRRAEIELRSTNGAAAGAKMHG